MIFGSTEEEFIGSVHWQDSPNQFIISKLGFHQIIKLYINLTTDYDLLSEAAKKKFYFSGPTTKTGEFFFFNIYLYILAQKLEKFFCQNPFPAILRRKKNKKTMTTKPRGKGVKNLSGRTTKKRSFFCGFPNWFIKKEKYVKTETERYTTIKLFMWIEEINFIINDFIFNNTRVKADIFWITELTNVYILRNKDDIQKNIYITKNFNSLIQQILFNKYICKVLADIWWNCRKSRFI